VHASLVTRRAVRVEIEGAELELALDRGVISAGARSIALCELEAELKHGDAAGLIAFARASIDAHGLWLSTTTKAARGHRLAAGEAGPRSAKAERPALDKRQDGEELFRAVLRSCLDHVLANASALAEGHVDDDVVHQLRVGIRRLRTASRELGAWKGALGAGWEAPMVQVFRELGDYRNRRTVAGTMGKRLLAAGSPAPALGLSTKTAVSDPVRSVRSASFQHALLDLLAFLMAPARPFAFHPAGDASGDDGRRTIAARLDKLHARLKRDAHRFEHLAEGERHRARKRLKRLRYLSELVASLYRRVRFRSFVEHLEPAQDELGHYMDLVVAARMAGDSVAAGDARAWFNVGWLKAQSPRAIERCRKALARVASARPYWRDEAHRH